MANDDDYVQESQYQKGVKHLCENGLIKVPKKYIFPSSDRPNIENNKPPPQTLHLCINPVNLNLPIIDLSELLGPNRSKVLHSLSIACQEYGFFQVSYL